MSNAIDINLVMTFLSVSTLVSVVEDTLDYFYLNEPGIIQEAAIQELVNRMDTTEISDMLTAVGLKLKYTVEKA